jgi:hypothetical protein
MLRSRLILASETARLPRRTPAHLDRIGVAAAQMFSSTHSLLSASHHVCSHISIALTNLRGLSIKSTSIARCDIRYDMDGFSSSLCKAAFCHGHRVDERIANMLVCTFKCFSLRQIRLLTMHNCLAEAIMLVEVT